MGDTSGLYVLAGAIVTFVPALITEKYKFHKERCAVAQAFIGEIMAILDMTERREYVKHFSDACDLTKKGQMLPLSVFDLGLRREDKNPVFENYIDKLGILPNELPKEIIRFYSQNESIRIDIIRLAAGTAFKTAADQFRIIDEDLKIWKETERLGRALEKNLMQVATQTFLPQSFWVLWKQCSLVFQRLISSFK